MTGRISKFTYGVFGDPVYNSSDPEHVQRSHKSYIDTMGKKRVPGDFFIMLTRVRHSVFTWRFGLNSIALQGTKILEDREIRRTFSATTKDAPRKHAFTQIIKYTGALASPEWEDVEPGRVFSFPWYLVKTLRAKRQVRKIVSCQGRHLQCSAYIKTRGNTKNGLQAELRHNFTRGPLRAQGTG